MKNTLLLPYRFKKIGWALLIPTLLLGILMYIDGFDGIPSFLCPGVPQNVYAPGYAFCHSQTTARILNNVALIGILVGTLFVACSRERVEDELITRIRLNSLLTALYANTAVVIIGALTAYDLKFLDIMVYNLLTLPVIFLVVFRCKLWRLRKEAHDEE